MFRSVLILSSIAVYSLLVAGCASDQAPPPAPITEQPRSERQALSPPPGEVRGAIPQAPVRESPRVDRFERPAPPPPVATAKPSTTLTDAQIVSLIIQESQEGYPGNCPCPENTDRAGRRCGGRSAYVRPGGRAPLCYPSDVTAAMIQAYRQRGY
jgi:hypothetical protein